MKNKIQNFVEENLDAIIRAGFQVAILFGVAFGICLIFGLPELIGNLICG